MYHKYRICCASTVLKWPSRSAVEVVPLVCVGLKKRIPGRTLKSVVVAPSVAFYIEWIANPKTCLVYSMTYQCSSTK